MKRRMMIAAGLLGCASVALSAGRRSRSTSPVLRAALAFLDTLDPAQKARVQIALNDEERLNWHYIPRDRKGLPLKEMTPVQRKAALELLRAGLSAKGYSKAETIRQLELVLREIENGNTGRDPERYFFTIFDTPSRDGIWGWRYEGHHCSQNWLIVQDRVSASSPQFFGTNPAEVRQGPMKGTRVLAAEEDLARTLLKSLDPVQRQVAVINTAAPGDIVTGSQRQAAILEDRGIAYSQLHRDQQGLLLSVIEEYAGLQPIEVARERLDTIRRVGLDRIKFAWMGSLERGQGHYYRIQGPSFLIEYDNTQDNANHIHSVWRDFKGDFGRDILAAHYQEHNHRDGSH